MATSQSPDLIRLQEFGRHLQQSRTTRRTLLKAALASGALSSVPPVATAAPRTASGEAPLRLAQALAPGTAIVASLRLPLTGIASNQIAPLIQGDVTSWHQVGLPAMLPAKLFAIEPKFIPLGSSPETVADYEALVEKFDANPGGFAMLPLEMIDPRVAVLDIDGVNPLLATSTDADPLVRIGIAGDVIFGRNGGKQQVKFDDWSLPSFQVKDFMSSCDVVVSNFECFVSETIDLDTVDNLDFVTRPESLQGLVDAGFDAVTMANNHAVWSNAGYGLPGMQETMQHLNDVGITPFGVGMNLDEARAPWVTEINGVSVAFIGIDGVTANLEFPMEYGVQQKDPDDKTPIPVDARADRGGTNPLLLEQNLADIAALAGQYDIVLPYFHMGDQYRWTPRTWVIETCRQCIDAGATVVLTAHPHATNGMEFYNGKPIFYSIGNYIYDQMFAVETRQGYFLELLFRGKQLVNFRIHPSEVQDFVQPRFLSSAETVAFWDRHWRSIDLMRQGR